MRCVFVKISSIRCLNLRFEYRIGYVLSMIFRGDNMRIFFVILYVAFMMVVPVYAADAQLSGIYDI